MFKVGSRLFTAVGPAAMTELAGLGHGIFLDLKFHDIPSTVAGAVAAGAKLPGVRLMTLHASGGGEMMKAARSALAGVSDPPKLLGVTVLTSLNAASLGEVGIKGPLGNCAVRLARLSQGAGMDGVVTSAREAKAIRRACGEHCVILVPGVRPSWAATEAEDQARVSTPAEAIRAGADYVVVGRPITGVRDPQAAVTRILDEIASVLPSRV
jgi:orotidine-5'-phosphate decarboxylase